MKKWQLLTAACFLLVCFSSCEKIWDMIHDSKNAKHFKLKSFTRMGRTYTFHYDKSGYIDSIVASESGVKRFTYRVTHRGRFIDSASLWDRNGLVSTNNNIRYNSQGQVTGYSYQLRIYYNYPSRDWELKYNAQGDIIAMIETSSDINRRDSFYYNTDHGLNRYISKDDHGTHVSDYTNDANINPLSLIPANLIFTEETFRDLWNNGRNIVQSVSAPTSGGTINYVNEYDGYNRITKSTASGSQNFVTSFEYH